MAVERENHITRPNFEGPTGWKGANGATATYSTEKAHDGTKSLKVVTKASVAAEGAECPAADFCPALKPTTQYTVSAWVFAESSVVGKQLGWLLEEQNSGGSFVGNQFPTPITLAAGWNRISGTFTSGAGAAKIETLFETGSKFAGTFFIDSMMLEYSGTLGEYFDGSTAPAGTKTNWAGTVDDSVSQLEKGIEPSLLNVKGSSGFVRKFPRVDDKKYRIHAIGGTLGTFRLQTATALNTPITRHDDVFITQWWETSRMAEAKALGSRVLIYLNSTRAQVPDDEGLYSTGLTLAEAEALGAKTTQEDEDEGGFICLPDHGGYAAAWLEKAIARCEEVGADGVLLDDMNVYSDGAFEVVSEVEWLAQMEAFNALVGPGLAGSGLLAIPNMSGCIGQRNPESGGWLEEQFQYYDGGMDEFFVTFPEGNVMESDFIEGAMAIMARQTAKGKLYLAGINGSEAAIEFAVALGMLQQASGNLRIFATSPGPDYSRQLWTTGIEHGLELGRSIDSMKAYERSYADGSVAADIGASTGSIMVAA